MKTGLLAVVLILSICGMAEAFGCGGIRSRMAARRSARSNVASFSQTTVVRTSGNMRLMYIPMQQMSGGCANGQCQVK